MCAIVGFISEEHTEQEREWFVRLGLKRISHRGREGTRCSSLGLATFGQCRLTFVAPRTNVQPAISISGQTLSVFNGEIYNYKELYAPLINDGIREDGDGPLIPELYERWGAQCFSQLNGMFAIALYSTCDRTLVLARDRFGKKPLYYIASNGTVAFASELSALQEFPSFTPEICGEAVASYFVFNSIPAPKSIYRCSKKVEPGHFVVFQGDAVRGEKYWTPRFAVIRATSNKTDLAAILDQLLLRAVQVRVNTEAPIGCFLSGGMDSRLIALYAAKVGGSSFGTCSVCFPEDPSFSEGSESKRFAQWLGVEHSTLELSRSDLAAVAGKALSRIDEPNADPSFVATYALSESVHHRFKGVLTGDGADELFCGYKFFDAVGLFKRLERLGLSSSFIKALAWIKEQRPTLKNLDLPFTAALLHRSLSRPTSVAFYYAYAAFPPEELVHLLPRWRSKLVANPCELFQSLNNLIDDSRCQSEQERLQISFIAHFLRDTILSKVDRSTMLSSIEARCPFLDMDVVDFSLRLSSASKGNGKKAQGVLGQVARERLGREFFPRKKRGFRTPVGSLLSGATGELLEDLVNDNAQRGEELLPRDLVLQLLHAHRARTRDHQKELWAILCIYIWLVENPHSF